MLAMVSITLPKLHCQNPEQAALEAMANAA